MDQYGSESLSAAQISLTGDLTAEARKTQRFSVVCILRVLRASAVASICLRLRPATLRHRAYASEHLGISLQILVRQREIKSGAFVRLAFGPDAATVTM